MLLNTVNFTKVIIIKQKDENCLSVTSQMLWPSITKKLLTAEGCKLHICDFSIIVAFITTNS